LTVGEPVYPGNRERLAAELRRLRAQAGLSGREVADSIGISQSKVSRIESGRALPSAPEVSAWAAAVGATGLVAELLTALVSAAHTNVLPWQVALQERVHIQDLIGDVESRANMRLYYQQSLVPGLLQTAEYARRVFGLFDPAYAEADIPAVVAARLERQVALFDPAQRFSFLITEGALQWRIGPAPVMLAQLDRIASVASLENVSVGLIPCSAAVLTHVPHGFALLEPTDEEADPIVMVDTVHASLTVSDPAHVELYRRQWALLDKMAVFDGEARELLHDVAVAIRSHPPEGSS
jgi:transcriptional regulator with XRE-family HTH domain